VMRDWRVEDQWMVMECPSVSAPERYANRDLLGLGGEMEVGEGINRRAN